MLGFSMYAMPYILKNKMLDMFRRFLTHRYFAIYARLTYGVFLCHSMFM